MRGQILYQQPVGGLQITYEELKPAEEEEKQTKIVGLQITYEELKLL